MNSYKNEIKNFKKKNNFRGYKQALLPKSDEKISRTDIGTPCGEYLRRYWHPVALTSEASTTPKEIRILGEDLVIFKTTENKIGLVHKNCPHRRASLVYGNVKKKAFDVVIMVGYLHQMVKFLKHLVKILIQNKQPN